jgi:hypothetical protein
VGTCAAKERSMLGTLLIIVLLLFVIGALPAWPYSRRWGYYPSGGIGLILLILIILLLMGRV